VINSLKGRSGQRDVAFFGWSFNLQCPAASEVRSRSAIQHASELNLWPEKEGYDFHAQKPSSLLQHPVLGSTKHETQISLNFYRICKINSN